MMRNGRHLNGKGGIMTEMGEARFLEERERGSVRRNIRGEVR